MADGHLHRCLACDKAYKRSYQSANGERLRKKERARYAAKKADIAAANRDRYATDPEYRDRVSKNNRTSRARRRDRALATARAWYQKNKVAANAAATARNRAHPTERAEYQRRMRARRQGATEITLTFEEWEAILRAHEYGCHYCGSLEDIGMDHQIPCHRGGAHAAHNVVPCCRSCNTSKGTQTPQEWARGWLKVA